MIRLWPEETVNSFSELSQADDLGTRGPHSRNTALGWEKLCQ